MREPSALYEFRVAVSELSDPVLLVSLDGFVDAGSAARQAVTHLFEVCDYEELATFDLDTLVDYRSRRPVMTFVDHEWTDYTEPKLALYQLWDRAGSPFLLLTGLEPDREWEAFVAAVRQLVDHCSVGLLVGFHGVPMAVPHTRPVTVTAHATRAELVPEDTTWPGRLQVPGSAQALLEYRLGQAGYDFIGYAVHVPSYLAQSEYPRCAMAALSYVIGATGLALAPEELESEAERTDSEIEKQVEASEEVQRVVESLEEQYDSYMSARADLTGGDASALFSETGAGTGLPSGDELGAALERYLAERDEEG